MKSCELCKGVARMYCESDQANLCRSCDEKVHSANFLVARHSRRLLCRVCQSPTPWSASGSDLGSTVSACERCFKGGAKEPETSRESENHDEDEDEEEREVEEEEDEGEIDSEDIQVVPWSSTPPPTAAESSSSDDSFSEVSVKRLRENDSDLQLEDNRCSLSSPPPQLTAPVSDDLGRPTKLRRIEPIRTGRVGRSDPRSSLTVDALGRFHREEAQSRRDLSTVDLERSESS